MAFTKFYNTRVGLRVAFITLSWFPVLYAFQSHVMQPCMVTGSSMSPTFNPGTESLSNDVVLLRKWLLRSSDSIKRGDVVMFRSPTNPEKLITKRVVGVQGDVIQTRQPPYPRPQAKISRNHLWVEGDNPFHSIDSNNFGAISRGLVVGKVIGVVWPLSRFGIDITKGGRDARVPNPLDKSVESIDDI